MSGKTTNEHGFGPCEWCGAPNVSYFVKNGVWGSYWGVWCPQCNRSVTANKRESAAEKWLTGPYRYKGHHLISGNVIKANFT